jgi:hypothetical protein
MTRRSNGPGTVSAEEVSKGCRRIVGFLFAGWFLFGVVLSFIRDNDIPGRGLFSIGGIINVAIPIAIFVLILALVRRNRSRSRDEGHDADTSKPTRRVESIRVEPTGPRSAPPPPPLKAPPAPQERSSPASSPQPPPQTLEEALEELGLEPSEEAMERFDVDLDAKPKSSQEMIEDARRKWGKDRRP